MNDNIILTITLIELFLIQTKAAFHFEQHRSRVDRRSIGRVQSSTSILIWRFLMKKKCLVEFIALNLSYCVEGQEVYGACGFIIEKQH